jgi:hypothetical protein
VKVDGTGPYSGGSSSARVVQKPPSPRREVGGGRMNVKPPTRGRGRKNECQAPDAGSGAEEKLHTTRRGERVNLLLSLMDLLALSFQKLTYVGG